jgi:hypothetical protein
MAVLVGMIGASVVSAGERGQASIGYPWNRYLQLRFEDLGGRRGLGQRERGSESSSIMGPVGEGSHWQGPANPAHRQVEREEEEVEDDS